MTTLKLRGVSGSELTEREWQEADDCHYRILVTPQTSEGAALQIDIEALLKVTPQRQSFVLKGGVLTVYGTHAWYDVRVGCRAGAGRRRESTPSSTTIDVLVAESTETADANQFTPEVTAKAKLPGQEWEGSAKGVGTTRSRKKATSRSQTKRYQELAASVDKHSVSWRWRTEDDAQGLIAPGEATVPLTASFVLESKKTRLGVEAIPGEPIYYVNGGQRVIDLRAGIAASIRFGRLRAGKFVEAVRRPPLDKLKMEIVVE